MPGRLLPGEQPVRAAAGGEREVDRALGPVDRSGEREVMRELAQVRVELRAVARDQRLAHAAVETRAPQRGQPVVERRAHQHVAERVAPDALGDLDQHARRDRLLERGNQLVPGERPDLLEHVEVELAADHRRRREHLAHGLPEPRQPARRYLAHALRHSCLVQGDRAAEPAARIGEVVHDLLDEERVAVGHLLQLLDERRGARPASERRDERARLGGVEACEVEPLEHSLAAQGGQQRRELVAPLVCARGGDEQRALGGGGAHQVADQLERREVGRVQVVEHDQQRRVARELEQQRADRVEQAQPPALRLAGEQRAGAGAGRRA